MKKSRTYHAIVGPTGVGKTEMAVGLASRLGIEVLSVDSRQVYRRMDIGTAKPDQAQQRAVRHHLIDLVEPDENYDAGRFVRDCRAAMGLVERAGNLPVLVGGTGLYLKSLSEGLLNAPPADRETREKIWEEARQRGGHALHLDLAVLDPETAARVHPNDLVRVVRALEVCRATGRRFSCLGEAEREAPLAVRVFVLARERSALYRALDARVGRMLEQGFLDEVRGLLQGGFHRGLRSMRTIGYRQITDHLEGRATLEEALEEMKRETRKLAKRQITWFRGVEGAVWLDVSDGAAFRRAGEEVARSLLESLEGQAGAGER